MKLTKEKYIGLGNVPIGIGAVIRGWNLTEEEFRDTNRLPVVDFRAMTPDCPHDCFFLFYRQAKKDLDLRRNQECNRTVGRNENKGN